MSSYFLSLLHLYSTYSTVHDACFDIYTSRHIDFMWIFHQGMVSDLVPLGSERWKTKPVSWKRKSLLEEEYGMDATLTIYVYIHV